VSAKHVQILLMLDNQIKQQSIKQCADELASKCISSSAAAQQQQQLLHSIQQHR
jgi:hypothetical protein